MKVENPFMVGAAYGGKIVKYNWIGDIIWEYSYSDTNHLQEETQIFPCTKVLLFGMRRSPLLPPAPEAP